MSMMRCSQHEVTYDSDRHESCPVCETVEDVAKYTVEEWSRRRSRALRYMELGYTAARCAEISGFPLRGCLLLKSNGERF